MRVFGWSAAAALVATVAASSPAKADSMDPALARLVTDENCRTIGPGGGEYYDPRSNYTRCGTDDAAFAKLMAEYGFAVAPTAMHTARSTGFGGFELAFEGAITKIDSKADYWKYGTEGPQDATSKLFSIENTSPADMLQVYMMKIRYGFSPLSMPLGLLGVELTNKIGFMANTNIATLGADVRVVLLEGFRTGWPAILPDVGVGGSVVTVTGTEEFQLTVAGFDAQVSKGIPIAGTVVLTPYVGYSWIRIFGDSGLIDLTPNTDAVNFCGYAGQNSPATPDRSKQPNGKQIYDGQPVCPTGSSADFNNTAVFDAVRLTRHRIDAGLQLRFQMIRIGGHFVTDLMTPEDANKGEDYEIERFDATGASTRENKFKGIPKQWTIGFDVGLIL